ncbi:MAG: hypothetical protein ABL929_01445 [Ferruginibacter sp.]|nr:hypothetical protein [Ferruginibacter sp.]
MKFSFLTLIITVAFLRTNAQTTTDTSFGGASIIINDARVEILEKKVYDNNVANAAAKAEAAGKPTITETSSSGIVLTPGYRLMVISTNDRDLAMRVRAKLYQIFPDQKQYMSFQMPNTKIKFGNFLDRGQADRVRKQIIGMKLVNNNIYVVPETVEMKVEKKVAKDDTNDNEKDNKKVKGKTK